MKRKINLITISVFLVTLCQAQEHVSGSKSFKPDSNDIGLSFNLTGLINNISLNSLTDYSGKEILILHKYIQNKVSLRFGFGLETINQKFSTVDSVFTTGSSQIQWDSTFTKASVFFAPGIEKHLGNTQKLDPFIGGGIIFGLQGKNHMKSKMVITDTIGVATREITGDRDGGSFIGLNLMAGFDFFITQKLCIGAEYNLTFSTNIDGGDWSVVTIYTPASGTGSTTRDIGSDLTSESGIALESTGGLTLSYYFSRSPKKKKNKKKSEQTE